jgi:uncharacterized protein (DUF2147 family)
MTPSTKPRRVRKTVLAALAASAFAWPTLAADPVMGDWVTAQGRGRVRVAPCAGQASVLCGAIVWLREPLGDDGLPVHDERNPDPALRNRPVVGLPVITELSPVDAVWKGRIYDPESGRTYVAKVRRESDGGLAVEGCVLVLCRKETWRPATP